MAIIRLPRKAKKELKKYLIKQGYATKRDKYKFNKERDEKLLKIN